MIPRGFVSRFVLLLVALTAVFLLATELVILPWTVAGPSMRPTVLPGDRLLVDLWTYRHRPPRAGEIVLVEAPDGVSVIKRVAPFPAGRRHGGEASAWILGDNPGKSEDSRHYGPVPLTRLRGRVVARYWPPGRAGSLPRDPGGFRLPVR